METKGDKLTIQEAAMYLNQSILITKIDQYYLEEPSHNVYVTDCSVYITPDVLLDLDQELIEGKLILRTIEDLTEEEKKIYNTIYNLILYVDEAKVYLYITRMVNYLRSIGVDCDGLIKQGKAIRKEKVK